jgi:hypothetical protein
MPGFTDWTVANGPPGQPTYPADLGKDLKKTHGTEDFGSLLCDNCNRCVPATHWCPTHKWVFCNACNQSIHSASFARWHKRTRIDETTPTTLGSVVHTWAFAVALDEDEKRTVWNGAVAEMKKTKGLTDHSGLSEATVESNRTDPHVAMITRGVPPSQIWEYLKHLIRSAVDPHTLPQILMAFVPFSVVRSDTTDRVLILPMGMQKTNGGRGIDEHGDSRLKPLHGALGGLFGAISLKFPTLVVLTAFSGGTHGIKTLERIVAAPAIIPWKWAFGENLSYFWREFSRKGKTSPQSGRPGGPAVNGDILRITNNDGTIIFQTQIVEGGPIAHLMTTGPTTYLGTIVCGWTL